MRLIDDNDNKTTMLPDKVVDYLNNANARSLSDGKYEFSNITFWKCTGLYYIRIKGFTKLIPQSQYDHAKAIYMNMRYNVFKEYDM